MNVELTSCAHRRAAIVRFAPRAQLQGGEAATHYEGARKRKVRDWFEAYMHLGGIAAKFTRWMFSCSKLPSPNSTFASKSKIC